MNFAASVVSWSTRGLVRGTSLLTTPLRLDEYLALANPLWAVRDLRGRVEAVLPETPDATTLVLRPGLGWRGHLPGQYVRVGTEIDGVLHWRMFSLSSPAGARDGRIRITVRASPYGTVSRHLAHRTVPGTLLWLSPARGGFVLGRPVPRRLLFLTAGSGITPVMAMLRTLAARGRLPDTVMAHSAPTRQDVIFGAELRGLAARFPRFRLHEHFTRAGGGPRARLTTARLPEVCPDWRERQTWACGPAGMLDDVERYWDRHGLADRLHTERFHPVFRTADGGGGGGRVRFTETGVEADADASTPLLAVGEDLGLPMPYGCRMGICFGCILPLVHGRVRDLRTGRAHGEEGDLIQTCVSAAAGPVAIEL
ncbi:ferredoxin reductase [Streptomyces sp. NPDC059785]|uniref:ferredoxin reductase n=1 Tax=Streptomyces sp. NPDC059785 TaxID=3346945 RepID=UPI00364A6F91